MEAPAENRPAMRFHDLDALRAGAMLLGIVLHAALFLIPEAWPVTDRQASQSTGEVYGFLVAAIHGFRMPLFFLLSGFFTALLWQRRGLAGLLRQRFSRIGLPLAVGCFTLVPLNILAFGGILAEAQKPLAPGASVAELYGSIAIATLFGWVWSLHHLWFLWHLLWLVAIFALLAQLRATFARSLWWLLVPLTLAPQLLMREFGPDTDDGLLPLPHVLIYYALFYLFGVFVYQRSIPVRRWWTAALLPAQLLLLPVGLVLAYSPPGQAPFTLPWLLNGTVQTAYAWLMCFGLMGLFRWAACKERAWVRYLSDASYWLYLAHLPLVVMGQRLAVRWDVNVHLEFLLICGGTAALLLATYQLGVRHTLIGRMLNGPRPAPA